MENAISADWVSAVLSGVAILVGLWIALKVSRQSQQIADRQDGLEREGYVSSRMQDLVEHAKETLVEAQSIASLTSPRLRELLNAEAAGTDTAERRSAVIDALSRLNTQVELLRVFAITMPRLDAAESTDPGALNRLMDEGAWLYADALHASILYFDTEGEDVDLSDNQSVVDALLNGSFVNLPTRLLSDCIGTDPDNVPGYREPGSPWPGVYERRRADLLEVLSRKSWMPDSLSEAGTWSLHRTLDRFQDALIGVLSDWKSFDGGAPAD